MGLAWTSRASIASRRLEKISLAEPSRAADTAGWNNMRWQIGLREGQRLSVRPGAGSKTWGVLRRLAEMYHGMGANVINIRLSGHGSKPEDLHGTKLEDWRRDLDGAVDPREVVPYFLIDHERGCPGFFGWAQQPDQRVVGP